MLERLNESCLKLEEVYRFSNRPVRAQEHLDWDILNLWQTIQNGLKAATSKAGGNLVSFGLDACGVDFGLLDSQDQLIGNPYHY